MEERANLSPQRYRADNGQKLYNKNNLVLTVQIVTKWSRLARVTFTSPVSEVVKSNEHLMSGMLSLNIPASSGRLGFMPP